MKKIIVILVLILLSNQLFSLDIDINVSYQPYTFVWDIQSLGENSRYNMSFDTGHYMVYQAGLKHRSGFNLGFGLSYNSGYDLNDNLIGHFSDVLAYLGFKGIMTRVTYTRLPGNITITGDVPDGQARTRSFNAKRTTVELFYNPYDEDWSMYYFGLYYMNANSPSVTENYGHIETTSNLYGIVFGMDTLTDFIQKIDSNYGSFTFDVWSEMWLYFGLGGGNSKSIDNKYNNDNVFSLDFRVNATLGLLFGGGGKFNVFGGIGYNVDVSAGILHGFIGRVGIKF